MLIKNSIYLGDCLDLMQHIDDKSIDLILCDLPYGTTYATWDKLIDFKKIWKIYERIIKDNGAIVLFSQQPFTSLLICSNLNLYRYNFVWEKNVPSNIGNSKFQPLKYTEDVCVFYKNKPLFNKIMIERSESGKKLIKQYQKNGTTFKLSESQLNKLTRIEIDPDKYDSELKNPSNKIFFKTERGKNRFHPTQKPIELCEYFIKTYTNIGDLVLDNCFGGGNILIAAKNLKRDFIGIEINDNYFNICKKRLNDQTAN